MHEITKLVYRVSEVDLNRARNQVPTTLLNVLITHTIYIFFLLIILIIHTHTYIYIYMYS